MSAVYLRPVNPPGGPNPLLDAALQYAARGWRVFPVHSWRSECCTCGNPACQSPAKHPMTRQGLHDGTTTEAAIQRWWEMWPTANIGIRAEDIGVVLDVDPRNSGEESLDRLLDAYGHLPDTAEVITGGGGRHIYLMRPEAVPITKGPLPGYPGIDVQASGAYVIAPPSRHRSGRRYEWEASSDLLLGQPVAECPDWLIRLRGEHTPRKHSSSASFGLPPPLSPAPPGALADIESALASLDPDMSYPEWVRVGQAIHSALWDEGLEVWDAWSAGSTKYPGAQRLARKWASFNANGATTLTTIFWLAKEARASAQPGTGPVGGEPGVAKAAGRLIWLKDIQPQLSSPWAVSRVLPRTGLALIFGESGSGKTYLATDIALHIATGLPWSGRAVHSGMVIYVASESPSSVQNRVSLWAREHGHADSPFAVLPYAVDLLNAQSVAALIKLIEEVIPERGPLAAIFVDTLSRSIPGGDENTGRDMGAAITSCDRIRDAFGALVCLVHHAGKDALKGARGHSSLRASVDTEIFVEANNGRHVATITKQRDDSAGARFDFRLKPHVLGVTDEGEEVTACLVADIGESSEPPKAPRDRMTASERVAMHALHEVLGDREKRRTSFDSCIKAGAKAGQYMAVIENWRGRFYERKGGDAGADANKKAFRRVRESLQAKGEIQCFEDFAWLSS